MSAAVRSPARAGGAHLTEGQRAAAAYRSLDMYEQEAKARMLAGVAPAVDPVAKWPQGSEDDAARRWLGSDDARRAKEPKRAPLSRDKAAKAANVSGRSVARYKRLVQQAPDAATATTGSCSDRGPLPGWSESAPDHV